MSQHATQSLVPVDTLTQHLASNTTDSVYEVVWQELRERGDLLGALRPPEEVMDESEAQSESNNAPSSIRDGALLAALQKVFSSDTFLRSWMSSIQADESLKENQLPAAEDNESSLHLLKRQSDALLRCFTSHMELYHAESAAFEFQSARIALHDVRDLAENFRPDLNLFTSSQFGVGHLPRFVEIRQAIEKRLKLPAKGAGTVMATFLGTLVRRLDSYIQGDHSTCTSTNQRGSSRCTEGDRTDIDALIAIHEFIAESARSQVVFLTSSDGSAHLKHLLRLPLTASVEEVLQRYQSALQLLAFAANDHSDSDDDISPDTISQSQVRLREVFEDWERNRIEAEKKRREAELEARRRKENEDRAKLEQRSKIRAAIGFITDVEARKGTLAKNPMKAGSAHPFYYLGFHPSKLGEDRDVKAVLKECRKLLPRLTHPDKLNTDDESEISKANEAFRLATEAVKDALNFVNSHALRHELFRDLPQLKMAPWNTTLGIQDHDGILKVSTTKPRTKKRGRQA